MPKKPKPNGFMMFMLDWKKKEEKKGRKFPNGLRDVQADTRCSQTWNNLTPQEKGIYNAQAKDQKNHIILDKQTGTNESISQIEKDTFLKQKFEDDMRDYIRTLVSSAKDKGGVKHLKFYFIHANWFYHRTKENGCVDYNPAEFAVAEVSLQDGVTNIIHEIINEKIALGYLGEATENSKTSHQIPPNLECGNCDYEMMYSNLRSILNPGVKNGVLPPLYTTSKIKMAVISILERFCTHIEDKNWEDIFTLYSLEELFASLHNAASQNGLVKMEAIVADLEISKDPFAYRAGLECNFHLSIDSGGNFCSESVVKQWFYILCKLCCELLDILIVEGVHKPKESEMKSIGDLNASLRAISLTDSKNMSAHKSMTGVSEEYRIHASERTYEQEMHRRNIASNAAPLNIIFHGASASNVLKLEQKPKERPLRPPNTISYASISSDLETRNSLIMESDNWPTIGGGRGSVVRRKMDDKRLGRRGKP